MALDAWGPARGGERTAYGSVDAALAALRSGDIDGAMVPIENSVEGGVCATLDALASGDPLVVTGEVLVPITFVLAARPARRSRDVCARSAPTATRGRRSAAGWASTCRMPCTCPTLSTAAAAAGLEGAPQRHTRRPCAHRPPPGCTGSRCSPTASATMRRR